MCKPLHGEMFRLTVGEKAFFLSLPTLPLRPLALFVFASIFLKRLDRGLSRSDLEIPVNKANLHQLHHQLKPIVTTTNEEGLLLG